MINGRVTYIGHSGFLVETEKLYFLFDYYQGTIPALKESKPVIVFVSHRHHDHFNHKIFELTLERENVIYILSYDVWVKRLIREYEEKGIDIKTKIISAKKNTSLEVKINTENSMKITTFSSTDEGVAFLIETDGAMIYHAGDLNCWSWLEYGKKYCEQMRSDYRKEMEKLKGQKLDLAFVPLDARLEKTAFEGLEIFLEYAEAKVVFPMHFWGEYQVIADFLEKHEEYREKVRQITKEGETFLIDNLA